MKNNIPDLYKEYLGSYDAQLFDGDSGKPIGWGYKLVKHLGDELFNGLREYGDLECSYPSWYLITRWLTRDEAIKLYGEITDEEFGPRGGWKSVTFGKTKFCSRHLI